MDWNHKFLANYRPKNMEIKYINFRTQKYGFLEISDPKLAKIQNEHTSHLYHMLFLDILNPSPCFSVCI